MNAKDIPMKTIWKGAIAAISLITLVTAVSKLQPMPSAIASQIEIEPETSAFNHLVLSEGPIRVVADYDPDTLPNYDPSAPPGISDHLRYTLYYDYQQHLQGSAYGTRFSGIALDDLDSDGTPEVIIRSYSNGAHCCTTITLYTWQGERFTTFETESMNSRGGYFSDLNNDGAVEFLAADDAFLYRFASYADSFAPPTIYTFRDGELVETTREHPDHIRDSITRMEASLEQEPGREGRNGQLAGYVAAKALVGEYEEGWQYMLENYNAEAQPNYPARLEAFLESAGYINEAR